MTAQFLSSPFTPDTILTVAKRGPTPFYLYDEETIRTRCREISALSTPFGLTVRYALKANSTRALIQVIASEGLHFDASSLNEVKRAVLAGISPDRILLTSQEVPSPLQKEDLQSLMQKGLKYTACSLTQLKEIAPFAKEAGLSLSLRIHPGVGSGESATRNTGDKYSSFGIHLSDIETGRKIIREIGVNIERIHIHIGSGGEPEAWRANIGREISLLEQYFPEVQIVNFGGGFRIARMPDEKEADIADLGRSLSSALSSYYERTGKKLHAEVEPGTFIVAQAGSLVSSVMDIKQTGPDGFTFVLIDGGMEVLTRPLLYGARHPFTLISPQGEVLSAEEILDTRESQNLIVVGRCCESGDSFTLDASQQIAPRPLVLPQRGDFLVVGGAGAYASSMSPFNYNSHQQAAEYLVRKDGSIISIRLRETLEEIVRNERDIG